MGLLDPKTMGLLMAAGAGLEASGPSRTPVSMGQVMSRGLLGGVQGYQQGVQNQQRGQMFDMQMGQMKMQEEMQREQMEQQRLARQQALALQQARSGIFGDPGVSPQQALAGGGGPTQANADMIRQPNPMSLNLAGIANYLRMPGADPKLIDTIQNLGPQGMLGKIDPKDYTTESFRQFMAGGGPASLVPVRKREAVEAMGADGSPETRFIDLYADNAPIAKPVRRESVNLGGSNVFVNPYTQTDPLARTVSPDAWLTDDRTRTEGALNRGVTMRGQNLGIDPTIQGAIAQARAAGTTTGNAVAQATIDLPSAIAKADQSVGLIDQMIGDLNLDENGKLIAPKSGGKKPHPGFSVGVGASAQPFAQWVPGTDKASFYALLDQVKGGAFLQAFETLKGGGQITEIEGAKATAAITRMDTSQSEAEFVKAAREFQSVIKAGAQRAKQKAGPQRRATDSAPVLRFDENGNPI
jgi:hypothetical protein